jgi:UDP-glucuronate decarboxylase
MHPADGRVVSNLVMQALRGETVTLYGDGLQTRSFCYVDDMIEAFLRLMDSPADLTGPVNLGNPQECTIAELAALIIELTGSTSIVEHRERPQDDPLRRMPDIGLAQRRLGWSPRIGLRDGLERTIDHFRRIADPASAPVARLVTPLRSPG